MKRVAKSQRARWTGSLLAGGLLLTGLSATTAAAELDEPPEPTRSFHSEGNPIISDGSRYTADAATLVEGDTLYVYAGVDDAEPQYGNFDMNKYDILATTDVEEGNWDHYENALSPGEVFDWATGDAAYAGGVTKGADDGRYYWYTPIETESTEYANRMAIGVAVSDSPVGPWEDAIGEPLVDWGDVFGDSDEGEEVIDPHTLVDDDGRVYLYWGSWYIPRVLELESDMVTPAGDIEEMEGMDSFFEAPWVTKRGGEYHMLYDWKEPGSDCTPSNYQACIAYATSDSPTGPWDYQGVVLGGTSSTTVHPSLIEFNDAWYMTYQTKDAKDGGHFRRSVAIDEVPWEDNRIQPVEPTRLNDPKWELTTNVALDATPSASYTETPPMLVDALNDGRATTALLPPDQWGNYQGEEDTSESDWVQYEWDEPVRVSQIGLEFHRDAGWIREPADWQLEYLDDAGDWQEIDTDSTPTDTDQWHEVDFDPVETESLRLNVFGTPTGDDFHAVSISEWEVHSAPISDVPDIEVEVEEGEEPELPATVPATYEDGAEGEVAVKWQENDAEVAALAEGSAVDGRALGYDAEYISAQIVVTDEEPEPDPEPTDPEDPDPSDPTDPDPSDPADPDPKDPGTPGSENGGLDGADENAQGSNPEGDLPRTGPSTELIVGAALLGLFMVLGGSVLVVKRRARN